jgi:hypothetical protein
MRLPLILLLPLIALAGCEAGPHGAWSRFYTPHPKCPLLPPTEDAEVRLSTRPALDAMEAEFAAFVNSSPRAPEDATREDRLASRRILIKHYRLPYEPEQIVVVGRSQFIGGVAPDPHSGHLQNLAKRKGANVVVVTQFAAGERQGTRIVSVPSYRSGTATAYDNYGNSVTASGSSWGWQGQAVPYTYTEFVSFAEFLRILRPDEVPVFWSDGNLVEHNASRPPPDN